MIAAFLSVALGVWMMAAPGVLDGSGPLRVSEHVIGPLVVGVSLASASPVMRRVRIVNSGLAAFLLIAGLITITAGVAAANAIVVAVVIGGLACVGRDARGQYGGGWRSVAPLRRFILQRRAHESPGG